MAPVVLNSFRIRPTLSTPDMRFESKFLEKKPPYKMSDVLSMKISKQCSIKYMTTKFETIFKTRIYKRDIFDSNFLFHDVIFI